MRETFLPFSPPSIGDEEIEEVIDTLRSDWITTGPKVAEFESLFAERVGTTQALGVSSCTDAMQVALAALGIGQGDLVFTTTLTFCATAHVVEHLGARPVFVDIESQTLNICPDALEKTIEDSISRKLGVPRAIIPVHFAGHPSDMKAILEIAKKYSLAVIEDAAHAFPASRSGEFVGSVPDIGVPRAAAFSFYATKNITTAEGGMLTATEEVLEEARLWSLHGMSRDAWKRYGKGGSWRYDVVRPGFKCNMTDIEASIGMVQLKRLNEFQERRKSVVESYLSVLEPLEEIEPPAVCEDTEHAWHLFPIRLNLDSISIDRDRFIEELYLRNIGSSVHFIPLHQMMFYQNKYALKDLDFPV